MSVNCEINRITLSNVDKQDEASDDESFEDAPESLDNGKKEEHWSDGQMDKVLRDCRSHVDLFMNYHFAEAMSKCEAKRDESFVFECGVAALSSIRALFSLEEALLDEAFKKIQIAMDATGKCRKKTSLVSRIIGSTDASNMTEEECHAEILYAELNVGWILLSVIRAKNFATLLKVIYRLQETYQIYRKCRKILETRDHWETPYCRKNFEAGVRVGAGFFSLAISYIPPRILKLIEMLGFSGTREEAFTQLRDVATGDWGFRSPIAGMLLMAHECTIEFMFGLGEPELDFLDDILDSWSQVYAGGGFGKFFRGLYHYVNGQMGKAIENYEEALNMRPPEGWQQIDYACYWGLVFCHAMLGNYEKAVEYTKRLLNECHWSPCTSIYLLACFKYMVNEKKNDPALKKEISSLMKQVPDSLRRIAGKSIYLEKSLAKRAQLYFVENETLLLPVMELFYIWNVFPILKNRPDVLDDLLVSVEREMQNYKKDSKNYQKYYYLLFMKAICLRYLKFPLQAISSFSEVVECGRDLDAYVYLQPHACMEIGLIYRTEKNYEESLKWFKRAKKNYRKYMNESMVHFKIHCAVHRIKIAQKGVLKVDHEIIDQDIDDEEFPKETNGNVNTNGSSGKEGMENIITKL